MLQRLNYDRFCDPAEIDLNWSGIEITIPVEEAHLRLYGTTGPVVAFINGEVILSGLSNGDYKVVAVFVADADTGQSVQIHRSGCGQMSDAVHELLCSEADKVADERFMLAAMEG